MKTSVSNSFVRGVCFGLGLAVMGGASSMGSECPSIENPKKQKKPQTIEEQRQLRLGFIRSLTLSDELENVFQKPVNTLTDLQDKLDAIASTIAREFLCSSFATEGSVNINVVMSVIISIAATNISKTAKEVLDEALEIFTE